MTDRYGDIAFTDAVKSLQEVQGSRLAYARRGAGFEINGRLGPSETAFIAGVDTFCIASVSETGWPYVQHRGGPTGFLRVLDEYTLGFADFRGNRQYITTGNIAGDDRVALLLIDFATQRRLKVFGRMRTVDAAPGSPLTTALIVPDYPAVVERGFLVAVEAFDWNCAQHIKPRFTEAEVRAAFAAGPPDRRASSEE